MTNAFISVTILVKHNDEITEHLMVGEQVAPGLAITPAVRHDGFTGRWTVTHTPSGWSIAKTRSCLPCTRRAAQILTNSDVDWTRGHDAVIADPKAAAVGNEFYYAAVDCDSSDCGWIVDHLAALGSAS